MDEIHSGFHLTRQVFRQAMNLYRAQRPFLCSITSPIILTETAFTVPVFPFADGIKVMMLKKKKSSIKQFSFTQLKFLNEVASQKNIIYKAAKIIFIKF